MRYNPTYVAPWLYQAQKVPVATFDASRCRHIRHGKGEEASSRASYTVGNTAGQGLRFAFLPRGWRVRWLHQSRRVHLPGGASHNPLQFCLFCGHAEHCIPLLALPRPLQARALTGVQGCSSSDTSAPSDTLPRAVGMGAASTGRPFTLSLPFGGLEGYRGGIDG